MTRPSLDRSGVARRAGRARRRLGFKRYAYDWRAEHLPDTARELRLAREHGIRVEAVWVWTEKDQPGKLSESNERLLSALRQAGLSTQLWVGFAPGFFERMTGDREGRPRGRDGPPPERPGRGKKSRVALYNHGDWFGEPENQVRIIPALPGATSASSTLPPRPRAHRPIRRRGEGDPALPGVVNLNGGNLKGLGFPQR